MRKSPLFPQAHCPQLLTDRAGPTAPKHQQPLRTTSQQEPRMPHPAIRLESPTRNFPVPPAPRQPPRNNPRSSRPKIPQSNGATNGHDDGLPDQVQLRSSPRSTNPASPPPPPTRPSRQALPQRSLPGSRPPPTLRYTARKPASSLLKLTKAEGNQGLNSSSLFEAIVSRSTE